MPHVVRSAMIDAPIADVWALLRDFNSHRRWHPAISDSSIEGFRAPDTVGSVRAFTLRDGGQVRERLLALSDRDHAVRYGIVSATLALRDYVSEMRLRPVSGEARTLWTWEGRFQAPAGQQAGLADLLGRDIYEAGFHGLRRHLHGAAAVPSLATAAARAIVMRAHGGPEVLRLEPWPVANAGPGEVRLRHTAIGVNFIDVYARTGRFRLVDPPGVPGMEAAGVVLAAGAGVPLRPGQRVAYACAPSGAYATERTMPADLVLPLPDDIDDVTAAAVLLKGMTAAFLLHDVHPVRAGETVLVHAAAGGTGSLLAQWASALGVRVIGAVGSDAKAAAARESGCDAVLVGEDVAAQVRALTGGRGVDAVFDGVGAATVHGSLDSLAVRGHLVSFGQASGNLPALDVGALAGRSLRLSRPNFGHYTGTRPEAERLATMLFAALRRGVLRRPEPRRWRLDQAADAHRALEARATLGSAVLLP